MKKCFDSYLAAVSDGHTDILEDIIGNRYYEFYDFYYMVRSYSDVIHTLKYHENSDGLLSITIKFDDGTNVVDIVNDLLLTVPKEKVFFELAADSNSVKVQLTTR